MNAITAKLFKNGQSQAVRIPSVYRFEGIDEVSIYKKGDTIIISPKRKSWTSFSKLFSIDEDFMKERPDLLETNRVQF